MAVIGVLNTLVQADTTSFDNGMKKAGAGAQQLANETKKQSDATNRSFAGITSLAGPLVAFLSEPINQIKNFGAAVTNVIGGVISRFSSLTTTIISTMAKSALGVGVLNSALTTTLELLGTIVGLAGGIAIGVLLAVGAAAVGAGGSLLLMARSGEQAILEMRTLALEIGSTVDQLSRLGSFGGESLAHSMIHMQRGVEEGSEGISRALSRINLNPEQLRGMDATQQIRLIAGGFSQLTDQGHRASVAMALFGRGGIAMIEDLSRGAAGVDAAAARAQRFGQVITQAQADAVKAANKEWSGIGAAFSGLSRQAAVLFAPMWEWLGKIGSGIMEWIVGTFQRAMPLLTEIGKLVYDVGATIYEAFVPPGTESVFSYMLDSIRDMIPWLKFGVEVARAFVTWIGDNFARGWAMAYDAIKAIGGAIAEALDLQRIQGWVGEWIPSWQQIKDTMLHGMAVVIVAFQQWDMTRDIIMNQAKQGWLSLQATVRDFASSTLNILADWTTSFRDGFIRTLTNGVSVFLGAMSALAGLDPTGALQARVTTAQAAMANLGNIPENAARAMRGLANEIDMGTNEIRDAIRELAENGAADLNDFLGRVARIVDRWRNELAGQVGAAVAQVNALPIASGQIKAITGHEAVTRESEKAFSMLFGNSRGQQDFYARLQAERALNQIEILRDIRGEIRNAPVMRRAAF